MCLYTILPSDEKNKILAKIPDRRGITVYKVVERCRGSADMPWRYFASPAGSPYEYKEGMNEAWTDRNLKTTVGMMPYKSGFHFFQKRKDAESLRKRRRFGDVSVVVKANIKKSWITEIGKDAGLLTLNALVPNAITFITKKAIFPKVK